MDSGHLVGRSQAAIEEGTAYPCVVIGIDLIPGLLIELAKIVLTFKSFTENCIFENDNEN